MQFKSWFSQYDVLCVLFVLQPMGLILDTRAEHLSRGHIDTHELCAWPRGLIDTHELSICWNLYRHTGAKHLLRALRGIQE